MEENLKKSIEGDSFENSVETQPKVSESQSEISEVREIDLASAGWSPVPVKESPSQGNYFPANTTIKIKSAMAVQIKNYSTMDTSSMESVEREVDAILDANIKITYPDGTTGGVNDLTIVDKLHYLFLIREKTMLNFNSKKVLKQEVYHPKNPNLTTQVTIDHKIFEYYDISEKILSYYDKENNCFKIYDNSDPNDVIDLKFYVPTVGVVKWVKDFIRSKEISKMQGGSESYNEHFMKVLQYITPNWRMLNEDYYKEKLNWYANLSIDANEVLVRFIDQISIGVKPKIKVKFGNEEVSVPINFRDFKSIFSVSSRAELLLPDS